MIYPQKLGATQSGGGGVGRTPTLPDPRSCLWRQRGDGRPAATFESVGTGLIGLQNTVLLRIWGTSQIVKSQP